MAYLQLDTENQPLAEVARGLVRWDDTHYCPAEKLTPEEKEYFRVVELRQNPRPVFNDFTHTCTLDDFEFVDNQWQYKWLVVPLPAETIAANLAQAKINKNSQINIWRAQANQSTFTHNGKVIACDQLSRSDIDAIANHISLFGTFPAGFPNAWKAVDNTYIMLPDVNAFKSMYGSMTNQGTVNFGRSQTLKAALSAATTIEEVEIIVW